MMCYKTIPVIQNQDKFSCFKSQLIVFCCLKVVQSADLLHLLPPTTVGIAWRVRGQGTSLRLQLLLLQGELDGWDMKEGRADVEGRGEDLIDVEKRMSKTTGWDDWTRISYFFFKLFLFCQINYVHL